MNPDGIRGNKGPDDSGIVSVYAQEPKSDGMKDLCRRAADALSMWQSSCHEESVLTTNLIAELRKAAE